LVNPVIIGDLNNNGNADAPDVTLMNSYISGTPRSQIPTMPAPTPITPTGASIHLSIPSNLTVTAGGTVVVPVNIDDPDPLGSGGLAGITLAIDYDPNVFTVSAPDVTVGTVTAAWQIPVVNVGMTGRRPTRHCTVQCHAHHHHDGRQPLIDNFPGQCQRRGRFFGDKPGRHQRTDGRHRDDAA
jgi:hypothetical protein